MKIIIVRSTEGDWMCVYRDGKLLKENHSFRIDEVLEMLEIDYEIVEKSEEWFEDYVPVLPEGFGGEDDQT